MTTPTPAYLSLEQIVEILQQSRDNADVFYAQQLEALSTEAALNATRWEDLFTLLNDMNGRVDGINAALEVLNNNSSLNAQNAQNIALGAIGVCCDDVTPATGTADQQCEKSQAVIDLIFAKMDSLGATADPSVLPTVQQLVDLFAGVTSSGDAIQWLSPADASSLLSQLATCGAGNIYQLQDAAGDAVLKADILSILGTATNASSVVAQLRSMDYSGYTASACISKAMGYAFGLSYINHIWDDPATISGAGYEDICGGEPPFEGSGWYGKGGGTDSGIGPGNIVETWQMNDSGDGGLTPNGFAAFGQGPMYCYCCFNTTAGEAKTVKVWTMNGSLKENLICTVEPGETVEFTFPSDDDWGIEVVDPSDPITDPSNVYLVFGWDPTGLSDHCPR